MAAVSAREWVEAREQEAEHGADDEYGWAPPRGPSCELPTEKTCRSLIPYQPWKWCAGCRRDRAVERISGWLRRQGGGPEVLSLTCFDVPGGSGLPDRRFDPIAMEADLEAALRALPLLERTAAELSRSLKHEKGRLRLIDLQMRRVCGAQWDEWVVWITEQRAPDGGFIANAFYPLLDRAALLMADTLGSEWW